MKKAIAVSLFFVIGVVIGWFVLNNGRAYRLDYNKVIINLPVNAQSLLEDKGYALGEKYLAEDMVRAFAKEGIETKLYGVEYAVSNLNYNAGIEIYMRHYPEMRLPKYHQFFDRDKIAVLYETVPYVLSLVSNMDIIFTGSLKRHHHYKKMGLNSYFSPQFTLTEKFYPAYDEAYRSKVLFVGNQWPFMPPRKSVQYAINNGIKIDVYGADWEKTLKGEYASWWKARQLEGDVLKYYYSSADIVLNDIRPDMIEAGVISNRIFDVTACKGFIISEYMAEIEEVYGDAIPMYHNQREFKELIEYYLAHPEERREKAERAYQITMAHFTSDAAMKQIVGAIRDYQKKHNLGD